VQVVTIKPTLKPPVSKSLKLKSDALLSNVAFNFNLRRYSKGAAVAAAAGGSAAGAYTRSRFSPT